MKVNDFLTAIRNNSDSPLLFEIKPGLVVQGGYHVTEIKNAQYETIDCGNSLHSWQEVIVQVWVPEEATAEDAHMPADKFLKIWDVVDSRLNLYKDAEIRIEYGDAEHVTSNYDVHGFAETEDGFVVQMAPPRTMCKPREILVPLQDFAAATLETVSCCAPSAREETVTPLNIAQSDAGSCCGPNETQEPIQIAVTNASCC